jgi:uncharacterized protein YjiS (DUF1127 family)
MSSTTHFAPRALAATGIRRAIRAVLGSVWPTLRHWYRVASTRRGLVEMDDRMLSDLGISRAQAEFELSRMPWTRPH